VDDDEIRAALRRGATDVAFRLLSRAHGSAIYARCVRILKNRSAAEDVMQQVTMAAFENRSKLLEVDKIRGWLMQIAIHKSLDALRSSKRIERLQHESANTEGPEGEDLFAQLATTEDQRALEACLAALESELAAAVLMKYRDDMSWEQIAEAFGVPPDTIRMRVQRGGMKSLRDCLAAKEPTP
jgi:RNA polymerase sigma-70 factor (ECF subfamily)